MAEIQLFGTTVDSALLFQIVMPTLSIIVIIFAYLNYRKKPATTFQNCTFHIQGMDPSELGKESVVKKISECIAKNVPEVTGGIVKDKEFELGADKLKLLNAIGEKIDQYSKASGKIVKDASILRALGTEAYYLGKPDDAFKYLSEALEIDEELKDIRGKAIDLNNIGNVYQDWGKPEQAVKYYMKALEIDEELKDIRGKANRLNNIGTVYQDWGKPEKALEYYQKALELFEKLKDVRIVEVVKKNIDGISHIGKAIR